MLNSASRLFSEVAAKEHRQAAGRVRELLAAYERAEDLINIGAYNQGSNKIVDEAIKRHDRIKDFLQQNREEIAELQTSVEQLMKINA